MDHKKVVENRFCYFFLLFFFYSHIDFSFMFSLIYNIFFMDLLKITGWNLLISNGNGIYLFFCVKKWYFHYPRKKMMTSYLSPYTFPWSEEISFLHTKGCGNAQLPYISPNNDHPESISTYTVAENIIATIKMRNNFWYPSK